MDGMANKRGERGRVERGGEGNKTECGLYPALREERGWILLGGKKERKERGRERKGIHQWQLKEKKAPHVIEFYKKV